jgi:hypothetical protein
MLFQPICQICQVMEFFRWLLKSQARLNQDDTPGEKPAKDRRKPAGPDLCGPAGYMEVSASTGD